MKRLIGLFALMAMPSLALAGPEHLATIESECAAQLKLPPGVCTCIKDKAAAMNDDQQAFIAATVTKNKTAQAALTPGMTVQDLTAAGMFMASAPGQCAKGQ